MSLYEMPGKNRLLGMVVGGPVVPEQFHEEAVKAGSPDEYLKQIDPELILSDEVLALHGISNAEVLRGRD